MPRCTNRDFPAPELGEEWIVTEALVFRDFGSWRKPPVLMSIALAHNDVRHTAGYVGIPTLR